MKIRDKGKLIFNAENMSETDKEFALDIEEDALRRHFEGNSKQYNVRKLEDVDKWRKRAGWFDDDESMAEYNKGVYNSYYSIDDDFVSSRSSKSKSSNSNFGLFKTDDILTALAQITGALLGLMILVMLIRAITRGSAKKKRSRNGREEREPSRTRSKSKSRSESRSRRSRSKSVSRSRSSRSRSRARRAKDTESSDGDYQLMDDGRSSKSRSSRSRSRNSRSRSRSKARSSRSKSRSRREELLV